MPLFAQKSGSGLGATKFIFLILVGVTLILVGGYRAIPAIEVVGLQTSKKPKAAAVIGELGGHAVSIPRFYADFLEYDGDPHWLERRSFFRPERTYASKIASFGFYIRYPEMEVLTDKNWSQKHKESIYTSTWLLVGINSNSAYGSSGDMALEAHVNDIPLKKYPYRYEELPTTIFGLIGYTPIGVDESKRDARHGADMSDKNIYFHRNAEGNVDAYIECSNVTHSAAPCKFRFSLLPHMRANVSVSFRKGLLPHWEHIQSLVSQIILGFRTSAVGNPTK